MKKLVTAFAVLALCHTMSATAAPTAKATTTKSSRPKADAKPKGDPATDATVEQGVVSASGPVARVIEWVASSRDNRSHPYIVIDKMGARAFLFDAKGRPLSDAPVLIGIATGDEATPGVGKKSLAEIGPAEKTTPAGRFLAKFGRAAGNAQVLWVDYATSVALHTIPPGNPKEHRVDRMISPAIGDNRITFGCINVPKRFYAKVRPLFAKKGGYVYVLPDTKTLEDVFPPIRMQPFITSRDGDRQGG